MITSVYRIMCRTAVIAFATVLTGCFVNIDLPSFSGDQPLTETQVLGEDGPKIGLVDVSGLITEVPRRSGLALSAAPSVVSRVREALELAADDPEVAALIVRVMSPGGTVTASETVHHELTRWREEHRKPVVAYLNGLATSGGYYVAMAADEVVAHPNAITGSIGVILSGLNFAGLLERFGVENQSLVSGPYKDAGSPFRPMRPAELAQLQGVVDDLHARFTEVVRQGRPQLRPDQVNALADGRIYTARQAREQGLVDALGYLEDAVRAAERRAGLEQSRLVRYHRTGAYAPNIHSQPDVGAPARGALVDVDVLPLAQALPPGFYYLWPPALPQPE